MDEEWHLAMRGAPATAIQELAGHQDLATTQRYMHLSPAALDAAIRLLEADVADGPPSPRATVGNLRRQNSAKVGEIMEAAGNRRPRAERSDGPSEDVDNEPAGVGAAKSRRSRDWRHRTPPPSHTNRARAKLGHFFGGGGGS